MKRYALVFVMTVAWASLAVAQEPVDTQLSRRITLE